MDLSFGPEYEGFRGEVVSFLASNADKAPKGNDLRGQQAKDWQKLLIEHGYDAAVDVPGAKLGEIAHYDEASAEAEFRVNVERDGGRRCGRGRGLSPGGWRRWRRRRECARKRSATTRAAGDAGEVRAPVRFKNRW